MGGWVGGWGAEHGSHSPVLRIVMLLWLHLGAAPWSPAQYKTAGPGLAEPTRETQAKVSSDWEVWGGLGELLLQVLLPGLGALPWLVTLAVPLSWVMSSWGCPSPPFPCPDAGAGGTGAVPCACRTPDCLPPKV